MPKYRYRASPVLQETFLLVFFQARDFMVLLRTSEASSLCALLTGSVHRSVFDWIGSVFLNLRTCNMVVNYLITTRDSTLIGTEITPIPLRSAA